MEAVNWQRGIVNFVDHMEANFLQYVETCVTENFLISYPKCGRTWVRIVLGKYLLGASIGNPLELDELTASRADSPNTIVTHDDFPHFIPLEKISQNKKMYLGYWWLGGMSQLMSMVIPQLGIVYGAVRGSYLVIISPVSCRSRSARPGSPRNPPWPGSPGRKTYGFA